MRALGVNCLGLYDSYNKLDAIFIPRYRLERPSPGGIGFVCQSGAVGSALLDLAGSKGYKFSKFISYGNATDIDESDLIEYLGEDKKTKVICFYVEGIKKGKRFFDVMKKVSKKKSVKITNITMELSAVITTIKYVNDKVKGECLVYINTDSQYVQKGITEWIGNWKRNGWLNSK